MFGRWGPLAQLFTCVSTGFDLEDHLWFHMISWYICIIIIKVLIYIPGKVYMCSHHRDKPQYHRLIEWCVGLQHAAKFFSSSHCILGSVAIEEQTDLEHCRVLQASVRKSTAYRKRSMQPSQKGQYPTNSLPAMTGQKPGRAIRGFARRIGEGVQSSKVAKIFDESPRQSVNQQ